MNIFLKRVTPPLEEPQAGASEGLSEKGIVIIRADSSVFAVAPEELPVGQEVEVEDSDVDDPDPV